MYSFSYSQTIEITNIQVKSLPTNSSSNYNDSEINLSDEQIPYVATNIEFSWNDFDPDIFDPDILPNSPISFVLIKNDGSTETLGNLKQYFINSNNTTSNSELTDGDFIASGHKDFSIRATYIDENGDEQIIAESDIWTITIIPTPYNQIYNNSICCNQETFYYPFDPKSN